MEYKTLGRTGLKVGVAGLGCGGFSKLGQAAGKSEEESIGIIHRAMELGVNLIDTAPAYGTEGIVGQAIKGMPRDELVLSTKHYAEWEGRTYSTKEILEGLDNSLRQLGTDYIDIYHIHAFSLHCYDRVQDEILPALEKERAKGKFRFFAASEYSQIHHRHEALQRAFEDDFLDVVMVAYSLLNQNAEKVVFPMTQKLGIGTQIMFAVRTLFSAPGRLQTEIDALIAQGRLDPSTVDRSDPLGFLMHEEGASSVIDACYRYVRHEPGADVVLFGTGDLDHLQTNLNSILKPPLAAADVQRLKQAFGHLEGVGLDGWHKTPDTPADPVQA